MLKKLLKVLGVHSADKLCAGCIAKDAHIQDLRSLVVPSYKPRSLPIVELEADAIMSGQQDVIEIKEVSGDDIQTQEDIDSEAERIFSANY